MCLGKSCFALIETQLYRVFQTINQPIVKIHFDNFLGDFLIPQYISYFNSDEIENSLSSRVFDGACAIVAVIGVGALARPAKTRAACFPSAVAVVTGEPSRTETCIPSLVTGFLYTNNRTKLDKAYNEKLLSIKALLGDM